MNGVFLDFLICQSDANGKFQNSNEVNLHPHLEFSSHDAYPTSSNHQVPPPPHLQLLLYAFVQIDKFNIFPSFDVIYDIFVADIDF